MLKLVAKEISRNVFRKNFRVLYYHRVNDYDCPLSIKPNIFEEQIKYLKKEYRIISQSEYLKAFEGKTVPKNSVLITLDDGYKDNYTFAYPILKRYSVSATIFLTTDFIDNKMWLWQDMLRYILNVTPFKSKSIRLGKTEHALSWKDQISLLNTRRTLYNYLKEFPINVRLEHIKSMARILEVNLPQLPTKQFAPLSWKNINEMKKNDIEFGAHTCTHEILSTLDKKNAYYEISQSKKRIEKKIDSEILTFAYPNGQARDMTEETKKILKNCKCLCI